MIKFIKENWILIFILIVAFILRVIGIFYSYPLTVVSDETPTLLASLKMIGTHSLRPSFPGYYYPALLSYILSPFLIIFLGIGRISGIFGSVEAMKEAVLLNLGMFIPVARFMSVFFGTFSVYLVYKICQKVFNKRVALLAAWFLAISYFHVSNSHFAQTWTTQTFFILLAFYYAFILYQKERSTCWNYVLSGLLVGLAFGINFVGIISYLWFIPVHFLKNRDKGFVGIFIRNKNFWLMNLFLLLTISLVYYLNPYGLNNYFSRITDPSASAVAGSGYSSYKPFSLSFLKILYFYIKITLIQEPIFFGFALIGSVLLWWRERVAFYFLIPWVVLYYLMISPLTGGMTRYLLPAIPLMAIVAAKFTQIVLSRITKNKIVWICLVIIVSAYTLCLSVLLDSRMLKDDTRVLARNWILNNISSGAVIKNEDLGESLNLIENKQSIELIKENYPALFSTKRKYLLNLPDEKYPSPSFFLSFYLDTADLIKKFDYVILSSFKKEDLDKEAAGVKETAELVKFFYPIKNASLLRGPLLPFDDSSFGPRLLFSYLDYNGPYIEIYKLK